MLLAFLIYLVQFLHSLKIFSLVMAILCVLYEFIRFIDLVDRSEYNFKFGPKTTWALSLFLLFLVIPSQTVSYTMAAGYVTQTIAETPQAKEIGGKVLTIINAKLDEIIADEMPKSKQDGKVSDVQPDGKDLKK